MSGQNPEAADLVLEFMGGMGNQMFQYAFYLGLKKRGRNAKCAISNHWQGDFPFVLDIFPNVHFEEVDEEAYLKRKEAIKNRPFLQKVVNKLIPSTREIFCENEKKGYDPHIFELKNKIITGYFQDLKYVEPLEAELRNAFIFPENDELKRYMESFSGKQVVSVHVRRGDYLLYPEIFGGICDLAYYEKAIHYFQKKGIEDFLFFSNDLAWVKEQFRLPKAQYFDAAQFREYQDWYDMAVMTCCSHHIIANSSFSWWGAWLNRNPEKIVVAPRIWLNTQKNKNICPNQWVRM